MRWLAVRLAELLGAPPPTFVGAESETALLSNCAQQFALFGYPSVPLGAAAGVDRGLDKKRPAAAEQANRIPGARRGLLSSQLAGVSHVLRGLPGG